MGRPVADVIEDAEFLDSTGVGAVDAAKRLDFPTPHAMEKWLERHARADLWQRMKARDPKGWRDQAKRGLVSVETVDQIAALIERGKSSSKARIRTRAEKIDTLIADLRDALSADATAEKEREKARAEVAKLERQLAEAQARLRGKASAPVTDGPPASEVREWAASNGVPCPAKGRVPQDVRDAYDAALGGAA